ncbi:MAG: hypothetical protein ACTSX6_03090 [Candidatus Heimdallarchaeaceae archaeon]
MSYTVQLKTKDEGILNLTPEIVDIIVEGMLDKNRNVREAAYSTWVSIVELESDKVTDEMLEKITAALKTYK